MTMTARSLFILLLLFLYQSASEGRFSSGGEFGSGSFVRVNGTHFTVNGHAMYINGFNSYWLTSYSFDPSTRSLVTGTLRDAAKLGLNVGRTWAFNDGSYNAIRSSPEVYNEKALQGLDFVIAEARRFGIRLILSLSNNYDAYGGKPKYVEWAREAGYNLQSDDEFFSHPTIRAYYKDYIQTVLTRVNSITGVPYLDDPTIFAWELMNEPRCTLDPSGNTFQAWIDEMSNLVKSLDKNHMLEIGLEGFYSTSDLNGPLLGSVWQLGTDFLRNNLSPNVDFTTVHCYPDLWLPNEDFDTQLSFLKQWIQNHVRDGTSKLQKPVLVAEFGKSNRTAGYAVEQRNMLYKMTYDAVFDSSTRGDGAGAGALMWQLVPEGLAEVLADGFQVVPAELDRSTLAIIAKQSKVVSFMNSRSS